MLLRGYILVSEKLFINEKFYDRAFILTFAPVNNKLTMKYGIYLAAALLVFAGCGKDKKKEKAPVRVKTEVAGEGIGGTGRSYVGIVEEREATAVSFTSMGVVRRVYVSEGQAVGRGQLIAELDASTSGSIVDAAQASTSQADDMVEQTQTAYNQAKDAYDRMKILHDNGSLPEIKWIEVETRLHQAETALRTAQSGVRSAKAAERIARKGLSDTRLYAPVGGIIGRRLIGSGETALPSQAVATILDVSSVKVRVSVPESEMPYLREDMSSTIKVEAAGVRIQGGRIEKGVQADAMTHTYDVRINVQNPQRKLLPGMVADVQFAAMPTARTGYGLMLPVSSVHRRADGSMFVWTVDSKNAAHRTTVTTGKTSGNRIAVLTGIKQGTRVVVEGYQKLSEGTRVAL